LDTPSYTMEPSLYCHKPVWTRIPQVWLEPRQKNIEWDCNVS